MINDTIVALSTAPFVSAIGVIRLSGSKAFDILSNILYKDIVLDKKRDVIVGKIKDNNKEIIDEVVCVLYKGPYSFTGEDVVEINCHGGLITINKIIELCISFGARMAERGEFSKKAFFNGKIDLIQAESINDLIVSKSEISSKLALSGLSGNTSNKIKEIKAELLELAAHISVNIDYPEYYDVVVLSNELIKPKLEKIYEQMGNLIKSSNKGRLIRDGIKTAIVGKPNAGKSSLLNCLLGEDKAIVTDIEGTTRDVVEGRIIINGLPFELLDTAGIRDAKDKIEQIGINKSKEAIEKADLVLIVIDGSKSIEEQNNDLNEFKSLTNQPTIIVINKNDKSNNHIDGILISAINNDINNLKDEMIKVIGFNDFEFDNMAILSNSRQIGLIQKAHNHIKDALFGISQLLDIDLILIDITAALDSINEILGEKTKENLEDEIFSKFCIGK